MALNIKNIETIIIDHMDEQPYRITCWDCGADLKPDCDVDMDNDFDLSIRVNPCESCMEEATKEALRMVNDEIEV